MASFKVIDETVIISTVKMKNVMQNSIYKCIYILLLVVLGISVIWCLGQVERGTSVHLYLLPLLCLACFLIFPNIRKGINTLSVLTMCIVCSIRYGIYPLTISIEKAVGSSYVNFSQDAVYLMMYEMVVALLFLNIYTKRLLIERNIKPMAVVDGKLTWIDKAFLFLIFPLVFVYPSLLSMFSFFGVEKSSIPLSGVVSVAFKIGLYIGYIFLLLKCGRNGRGRFLNLIMALLIAILFIFFISVGEDSVSRWAFLWIGVPTLIILTNVFPKYKKAIVSFACIALPLGIIAGSFIKFAVSDFSVTSFFSNFINSDTLSEYFGGLNGLTFTMQSVVQNERANTFYSVLTDLFCSAPLLSSLFDFDNYSTQSFFLDSLGRRDLICPLLGQSYCHFGFWGAPIFSLLMIMMAVEFERISQKTRNVYLKYATLSLCITFSLFMCLNTIIIMSNAWVLIMFILVQFCNRKKYAINNSSNL